MEASVVFDEMRRKEDEAVRMEKAMNNAIIAYFQKIARYKLLTKAEEIALIKRVKTGDMQAREAMINANLRLVVKFAKRRRNKVSHLHLGDLIDAGNEGLIRAVDRFKTSFKCRFSTYATYWIIQAIGREVDNFEKDIRSPIHVLDDLARYNKSISQLKGRLGRWPTATEISIDTDKPEKWVTAQQRNIKNYVSFDAPVSADEGQKQDALTIGDCIAGSDGTDSYRFVLATTQKKRIMDLLEHGPLNEKEKTVLCLRFGIGDDLGNELTLDEVGERFGLTREGVRQVQSKAIKKLQQPKYIKHLRGLM